MTSAARTIEQPASSIMSSSAQGLIAAGDDPQPGFLPVDAARVPGDQDGQQTEQHDRDHPRGLDPVAGWQSHMQAGRDDNRQRNLLERFEIVDAARKVVGVGSVGTRAFIVLLEGRDAHDPLLLQINEATASVLEQSATEIPLGRHRVRDRDPHRAPSAGSGGGAVLRSRRVPGGAVPGWRTGTGRRHTPRQ